MTKENNNSFTPEIDTGGTFAGVVDAPNIEYDQREIKPGLIEQKKRDIIYKGIIFISLLFLIAINSFVTLVYDKVDKIALVELQLKDLHPVIKKIEETTKGINYDKLKVNKFMLENLFFVGDKKYEIIQKFHTFFKNPKVISQLGDFKLKNITVQGDIGKDSDIARYKIKIEGTFSSFNKDLKGMITFLNRIVPIVVIEETNFTKGNNVSFIGYILVMKKDLIKYDYGKNYKQINKVLRLKEEYEKNSLILEKILADKDLGLKKEGISKLYNCDQYKELIAKKNLVKDEDLELCYNVEDLLHNIKKDLDMSFNSLTK